MYKISLDTITEPPSSLFSHEILLMLICWLYPMIATTGDARVYCATKICFYMFTMRRFSRQTHTFGWKFYHALCSGSIALRIYHCRNFYPSAMLCTSSIEHRVESNREKKNNCMMVKKYPPSHGSSLRLFVRSFACCSSLMRSSVQTHIYVVVVITQYILCSDSLFCMIAILNIREKSMLLLFGIFLFM